MSNLVFKSTSGSGSSDYTIEAAAGELIFQEGDLGTEMYLIQRGSVEIFTGSGSEEQHLATLGKGDFFGEMAILEDLPRAASARAATNVRLLRIDGSTFTQMIQSSPEIAVRMMRKLSRRLRETDRKLWRAQGESGEGAPVRVDGQPDATVMSRGGRAGALIHEESAMEFALADGSETTIGRRDPVTGIHPTIDLTPVDHQRSISRRHAKIFYREGKYYIVEETSTMNGTFKNGRRLETGVPAEIRSGDSVRCGLIDLHFNTD